MRLTTETADKIAARHDWDRNGWNSFRDELTRMLRTQGLSILTEDARRDLIVALGKRQRERERSNIRSRAQYAAMRAELSQAAE